MTYQEQLEIEKLSKENFIRITENISAEEFINYYKLHTKIETKEFYNINNDRTLKRILNFFEYDWSVAKSKRGKSTGRTHESYILGGQKSAKTQKQNWENKSVEEKEAWSIKQSEAHLTNHFRESVVATNKAYRALLTEEEKQLQDKLRSESMKQWWSSLSEDEKQQTMEKRFINGKSYSQKDSKPNLEFAKKLSDLNIVYEREICLDKKLFDFKINNILVEINPTFTHNSTFTPFEYNKPIAKNYHSLKTEIATKYSYRCIHIFDWDDQNKILNLINNKQNTIYGRECQIKEIDANECKDFLVKNHLQGNAKSAIKIGLYYQDNLVSVMTFGKPRYNKNYEYELIRYCSSAKVIGGSEKLFSYFINKYSPKSVISYCDLSKFTGNTYIKLGFTLLRKPTPSKHWYNTRTKEHYTDALLRQQGFSRLIHHCAASEDSLDTDNNRDLMIGAGFVEVFDCGQATYIWNNRL